MKYLYLFSFLAFSVSGLMAQRIPDGVTKIDETNYQARFIFKDRDSNIWVAPMAYHDAGLFHYNSSFLKMTDFNSGAFTAYAVSGNYLYFSSADGLYSYSNGSFSLDSSVTGIHDVAIYNDSIYIIDTLQQLYKYHNGNFTAINLQLSAGSRLNALHADNNYLWVSTSAGLLRFDGTAIKHYKIRRPAGIDSADYADKNNILNSVSDSNGQVYAMNFNFTQDVFSMDGDSLSPLDLSTLADCNKKSLVPVNIAEMTLNAKDELLLYTHDYVMTLGDTSGLYVPDYDGFRPVSFAPNEDLYNAGGSRLFIDTNDDIYFFNGNLYRIRPGNYNDQSVRTALSGDFKHAAFQGNNLNANVCNDGFMFNDNLPLDNFFDDVNFSDKEFDCASLLHSAGLSLGAVTADSLYVSSNIERRKGSDFYPGPLDTADGHFDSTAAAPYNRIWKVSSAQIREFRKNYQNSSYVIPRDILEWPAHGTGNFTRNMAPFVDSDGNGVYEPVKGDYPKIKGDLMYWWVFNDVFHRSSSGGRPLVVEVHASCYAYACDDFNNSDTEFVLNRSLFFDFRFINRSGRDYNSFYAGTINKSGMGYPYDNFAGCDVEMNAGYLYDASVKDQLSWNFGDKKPMLFCKLLNQDLSSFSIIGANSDPVSGYPKYANDYYNYLRGSWMNGLGFKYGGNGTNGTVITQYMFDGGTNPATRALPVWTEKSSGNMPGFRLFQVNADMKALMADSTKSMELAYVMMQKDNTNFYNDYAYFRKGLRLVQSWYDHQNFPSCTVNNSEIGSTNITTPYKIYPNPSGSGLFIDNPKANIEVVEIVDLSGKVVMQKSVVKGDSERIAFDISGLSSGAYLVRIVSADGISFNKFVKL